MKKLNKDLNQKAIKELLIFLIAFKEILRNYDLKKDIECLQYELIDVLYDGGDYTKDEVEKRIIDLSHFELVSSYLYTLMEQLHFIYDESDDDVFSYGRKQNKYTGAFGIVFLADIFHQECTRTNTEVDYYLLEYIEKNIKKLRNFDIFEEMESDKVNNDVVREFLLFLQYNKEFLTEEEFSLNKFIDDIENMLLTSFSNMKESYESKFSEDFTYNIPAFFNDIAVYIKAVCDWDLLPREGMCYWSIYKDKIEKIKDKLPLEEIKSYEDEYGRVDEFKIFKKYKDEIRGFKQND